MHSLTHVFIHSTVFHEHLLYTIVPGNRDTAVHELDKASTFP